MRRLALCVVLLAAGACRTAFPDTREGRPAAAAAPVASAATDDTGDAAPALSGGLRASWLMAEAAAPTTGRRKRSDLQGSRR